MILRRLLCGPAPSTGIGCSLGLLLLRVSVGSMMLLGHGWGKIDQLCGAFLLVPRPLGHRPIAEHGLGHGCRSVLCPSGDFGIRHPLGCCAAHGHHASGRAYHTRGRPLGEKGIRPAVLFPLCHPVFSPGRAATRWMGTSWARVLGGIRLAGFGVEVFALREYAREYEELRCRGIHSEDDNTYEVSHGQTGGH